MSTALVPAPADTVDLADVGRTLRRGWRAVATFTVLGAIAALAVVLFAPRKFTGSASILIRTTGDAGSSLLSKLGGGMGDAGSLLSGAVKSPIETEVQILSSRAVAGRVVDSLLLQAEATSPRGLATTDVVQTLALGGSFKQRKYHFERQAGGNDYRFAGRGASGIAVPGQPTTLPVGTVTLRSGNLPVAFDLSVRDREDAINRFEKNLAVDKAGTEVAHVSYRGDDSITAAAATNAVVAVYLHRRATTDRGTNQHRVEFLTAQTDSAARALTTATRELRHEQESSGVIDPEVVGKIELERASDIRKNLGDLAMEDGAMTQLIARVSSGAMQPRELAAYPAFLKSAAINELLGDLADVETQRYKLLETRTEKDPEVLALAASAQHLEGQLMPLARSYATSVGQQRAQAQRQFDSLQTKIAALPAVAESGLGLQRDVRRLTQVYAALQAQLVEARLAAISEGGDVHVLDAAVPQKLPSFPQPALTMAIGVAGGLFAGMVAALLVGALGRWVQDPSEVERRTGVPALRFDPSVPLLMNGVSTRTVLVVPLDDRAGSGAVAHRLARTAESRSIRATILDLSNYKSATTVVPRVSAGTIESVGSIDVAATIGRLEDEYGMVIVRLPGLVTDAAAAALHERRPVLIVAPPTRIDREKLVGAVQLLRRLDVPCAGVVLNYAESDAVVTS